MTSRGILDRYLLREAGTAWFAVTLVLLAIMLSTRFARFLAQAAAGNLPRELLFEVAALSSLQYLVVLIPFSLLMAIMLALGRLYKDNEIAAMTGCGAGFTKLYRPFLTLAAMMAFLTAALSFEVGPWAGRTADTLVRNGLLYKLYNPFEPGHFKTVFGGHGVFYTTEMDETGEKLGGIFALIHEPEGDSIVTAKTGSQRMDESGNREVSLRDGFRYRGIPGTAHYDLMRYEEFRTRVAPPEYMFNAKKRSLEPTSSLIGTGDKEDAAEMAMRIAMPIAVFILGLLAVPLSHVGPREGRYGKLVIGILVYLAYSQLLALGQNWIAQGKPIAVLGLWWVHAIVLSGTLWLILKRRRGQS